MLTVGDWLAFRTATAPSTVRCYAAHVRLYLTPYLGEVLVAELTAAQVQAMFAAIIRHHHALGTPVWAATPKTRRCGTDQRVSPRRVSPAQTT